MKISKYLPIVNFAELKKKNEQKILVQFFDFFQQLFFF